MEISKTSAPLLLLCAGILTLGHALKSECKVEQGSADCSHMKLNAIPQDLPENITALDVSHNRLTELIPSSLVRYKGLVQLDVSYNSLTSLPGDLCQALPELRGLCLKRNEVHVLQDSNLINCRRLTHLDLSGNRLKLKGEPFLGVKNLTWLDVSQNQLTSARLGSKPQLQSLETLLLTRNDIKNLLKEDFLFLSSSSAFRTLGLSSLPLKKVESGCFKPVASFQNVVLDDCKLSPSILSKICEELSNTAVRNLSLKNAQQVTLTNATFKGLAMTNLTILDLTNNNMAKIAGGSFQWLPVLEFLSLENNNIKHLNNGTFMGLKNLRELNLRAALRKSHGSPYPIIGDYAFQALVKLEYLWMDHCYFREIPVNMFYGLKSLRKLNLSWSSTGLKTIINTTFTSLNGSQYLQSLNLSGMGITKVDSKAFLSLNNLSSLILSHNFISQQLTGEEFWGLNNVQEINLSFNQQKIGITSTSFIHVPRLRTLMLGRAITANMAIEPSPFRMLTNLTFLDLSNNNIANIKLDLLDGLKHLKVLKLQHNNLARVWKNANPGGPVLFLKDAQNLSVLELDYNGLDEIPVAALQGLSQLKELSLSGNLLNYLHHSIFDGLLSLRILNMQKNLLTTVKPETFKVPLSNLTELRLDHNPFDCTCESILWFSRWLNTTNASVPDVVRNYVCNTPTVYFNHSLKYFNPESCKDMTPFQALCILSSTLVLGLMFIAFLVHFQGWRIQFFWNILINRTLGMKEDSSYETLQDEQYEYDAYIIHAEEDKAWVERSLLSLEKCDLNFFLEYRNAVPGHSRLETIVDNMKKSKKIVFIVTEALLNDPWCRQFKAHYALQQLMEESRDSLILIFLQDVTDYHLSRSLLLRRGMLKHRCIVYWPLQKERIPAFHQKLQLALASSSRVD